MIVHILNMMQNRTGSQSNDFRSGTEREKRADWETTLAKQFSDVFTGKMMKEGITVIKFATNKLLRQF